MLPLLAMAQVGKCCRLGFTLPYSYTTSTVSKPVHPQKSSTNAAGWRHKWRFDEWRWRGLNPRPSERLRRRQQVMSGNTKCGKGEIRTLSFSTRICQPRRIFSQPAPTIYKLLQESLHPWRLPIPPLCQKVARLSGLPDLQPIAAASSSFLPRLAGLPEGGCRIYP